MEMGLLSSEFDQCIKCGLCLANCPINHELFLEKYTPRGKIQLARAYGRGKVAISDHYRDIFARCLLCGACSVTCPSGVDLTRVFTTMRKEIAEKKGICCGGGGNLEMTDTVLSGKVAHRKINEIRKTGAETVVTACQQCVRSIKGRVRLEKLGLEVMDISTVVARAVSNA